MIEEEPFNMRNDGGMILIQPIVSLQMIVQILFLSACMQEGFQCGEARIERKDGG